MLGSCNKPRAESAAERCEGELWSNLHVTVEKCTQKSPVGVISNVSLQHNISYFSVFFKENIRLFPLIWKNSGTANPAKSLVQTCFPIFFFLPFCSHRQDCLRSHLLSATTDPLNVFLWTFFSAPRSRVAE